jgi:PAS domain S-box-containing protein
MSVTLSTARARILVVDDEIGPRESLRMLLKTRYDVATADGGAAALRDVAAFRPDLLIMDIKMPQIDGLEVLRRVKAADPSIEVIMISAYASVETVRTALTYGAFEYLIKPFARQDLEETVRRALARRQAELGQRGQVAMLVREMRQLAAKTRELEEAARREAAEQSLRVTQLSILRELSGMILSKLDPAEINAAITQQLRTALGYERVDIMIGAPAPTAEVICEIRDAEGLLGHLVVDTRTSGRELDSSERELLGMLCEYLAIALRNSRLYSEIADTKRSLEQLIFSAGDAIISTDQIDRVVGWNPAAERIFGVPAASALGRPIAEFLPAEQYGEAKAALTTPTVRHAFDARRPRPESKDAWLSVTLSAVRDREGAVEGTLAIVRDITAQRELEAQMLQSEKLAALGQLAGGIAHNFNNQLQAILGYTQLMLRAPGNLDMVKKGLSVVESAALGGTETVRRIQEFARLRPGEALVPVDLNQVIRDAVTITRPRWEEEIARSGVRLDLQLSLPPVPRISGRPAALTEVFTNLILNAIDAMPHGGRLSIGSRSAGSQVTVAVSDTGLGMPESVRRRAFEPFFSTKGERGSGLGLSVSYSIVKRQDGDIQVDSEEGAGTTFTLTFPVATTRPRSDDTAGAARPRRQGRVLLVDDEQRVLHTLREMLVAAGHTVTVAGSGAAALQLFASRRFDLLLTNLGMAEMNGWELTERVRREDAGLPVVFITGWGLKESDQARLRALNVQHCLFKPVNPADLEAAVQAAL